VGERLIRGMGVDICTHVCVCVCVCVCVEVELEGTGGESVDTTPP